MTQPYTVVALSPVQKPIREPEDALENTKRIVGFMKTAVGVAATESAPVKLVVIPEMAIQGMHMAFTAGNREAEKKFARTSPAPKPTSWARQLANLIPTSPESCTSSRTTISRTGTSTWPS